MEAALTDNIPDAIRAHGLTPSAPRVAIYRWLVSHPVHPTVDTIFSALRPKMKTLSRTTVYNVLHAFVECGLAAKVHTEDTELRYDGNTHPHVHFRCTQCGCLMDLADISDTVLTHTGLPAGAKVTSAALNLWGLCPACAAQAASADE